jgi:DNA-directed RNA polymerase subunit L
MPEDTFTFKNNKYDIKIEEKEYHKSNGLDASWLTLICSGEDFNVKLLNALRRTAVNNIPMYAFSQELVSIDINTSVAFDTDYMTARLSNLPVIGIDPNLYFLPEKYWYKVNYADTKRERHPTEQHVEFYLNYHNNSANIVSVTTNDASVYIGSVQVKPYSKEYPILLIKLKPNERFKCYMKATLGVGEKNVIWKGARNAFYDEIEVSGKKKYEFTIEANNQCTEYNLLVRACKFLMKKITDVRNDLQTKIDQKQIPIEKSYNYKLEQEDFTVGIILNEEFQDHKDIIFSGLSKPDHLVKAILIKVVSGANTKSPLNAMIECMDNLIKKYAHIGYLISNMNENKKNKSEPSDEKSEEDKAPKKVIKKK